MSEPTLGEIDLKLTNIATGLDTLTKQNATEHRAIVVQQNEFHRKMFVGNGGPSMAITVDRNSTFRKGAIWIGAATILAVLGLLANLAHSILMK